MSVRKEGEKNKGKRTGRIRKKDGRGHGNSGDGCGRWKRKAARSPDQAAL